MCVCAYGNEEKFETGSNTQSKSDRPPSTVPLALRLNSGGGGDGDGGGVHYIKYAIHKRVEGLLIIFISV